MAQISKPSYWAQKLLRMLAHPDTLEEVHGDLEELFKSWVNEHGITKARWRYIRTVITLLRPFPKRKYSDYHNSSSNHRFMLASYFKMSWRSLLKNRVSAVINISGLTLGLATSIIIMLVVLKELSYDKFHVNLKNIFVLMKNQKTNDGISTGSSTSGPIAEAIRSEFPGIKYVGRMVSFDEQQVIVNDKISYETGIYFSKVRLPEKRNVENPECEIRNRWNYKYSLFKLERNWNELVWKKT